MQRVTPGISNAFGPVEEEIAKAFLPALFEGVGNGPPGREITRLPVKQAGMALPDPTQTAPENCWAIFRIARPRALQTLAGLREYVGTCRSYHTYGNIFNKTYCSVLSHVQIDRPPTSKSAAANIGSASLFNKYLGYQCSLIL